ncbi:anthrone oxygenase family protein [Vibrio atypicus]|uniref:anthrone oxygenase family protein n=1 Tax=Vibrio atypicus TaxID=558271 RepID=UPI001357AB77|nr:anthrone oxygenase family protein [Vibrio atypicus]
MLEPLVMTLSLVSAVTTAMLAGLYFIFHNTVMPVFKENEGALMMQRINDVIINKQFLLIFVLSPLTSLGAMLLGLIDGQLSTTDGALYGYILAILAFMITATRNVPLNNELKYASGDVSQIWKKYVQQWGSWNTKRYYLSLMSSLLVVGQFVYD